MPYQYWSQYPTNIEANALPILKLMPLWYWSQYPTDIEANTLLILKPIPYWYWSQYPTDIEAALFPIDNEYHCFLNKTDIL